MFEVNGRDVDWKLDPRITRARKAANRTSREEQMKWDNCDKKQEVKLPISADMIKRARCLFWEKRQWGRGELEIKWKWLALALGFDSGLRPGMMCLKEGKDEDHCIRFGRICFILEDGTVMTGGQEFNNFIMKEEGNEKKVAKMDACYVTHKMWKSFKGKAAKVKSLERRSLEEGQLLNDLCTWFAHANTKAEDEIFTRYYGGFRKVMRRRDVSEAIKTVAKSCGLNPKNFSAKCLRLGYASHCKAIGIGSKERNERGTWAKGSTVPDNVYESEIGRKGAMAYGLANKGLSTADLKRMTTMVSMV
jgi:hypothetical protein